MNSALSLLCLFRGFLPLPAAGSLSLFPPPLHHFVLFLATGVSAPLAGPSVLTSLQAAILLTSATKIINLKGPCCFLHFALSSLSLGDDSLLHR